MNNQFSKNLKQIRKNHNLSQEQLADEIGVSRQAISKWESAVAYPEMDKIIALCDKFNINIDDLLHKNIKEVKGEEESKKKINNFLSDFLNFITDTINLFSNMNFKSKIKCLFEQAIIIGILLIISIIGVKGLGSLFSSILSFLPYKVNYFLQTFLISILIIVCIMASVIILVHVFKTRYLDYYAKLKKEIEETKEDSKEKEITTDNKNKILLKNEKKIIIRDPKHSDYKFINALIKYIVFILKAFILCMTIFICIPLIISIILLVLSFALIKTGLFFMGILISIIACGIFLTTILLALLNFILNRKNNKKIMIYVVIISIISFGFGCGLSIISLINFNYIDVKNSSLYEKSEIIVPMDKQMFINDYYSTKINYQEENRNDIRLEFYNNKYCDVELREYDNGEYALFEDCFIKFKMLNDYIKDINNKKIYELDTTIYDVTIYTSKENIEILKNNLQKYNNENDQQIKYYENRISELETNISDYQTKISELESQLNSYEKSPND